MTRPVCVIARPGVRLGLADPRFFDASGYRALMAFKLAEQVYQKPGLLNGLVKDQFQYPITAFEYDLAQRSPCPRF